MTIDLSRVLHGAEDTLPVELDFSPMPEELSTVVHRTEAPFHVSGTVKNIQNVLYFDGTIRGAYVALCSRCNCETRQSFSIPFHEVLLRGTGEEADGIPVVNDAVEVYDAMVANVVLNLPMQVLCREDCKGLCPHCGADLNIASCNCETRGGDERLLVLRKLLDAGQNGRDA